jgi:hypothetical protein
LIYLDREKMTYYYLDAKLVDEQTFINYAKSTEWRDLLRSGDGSAFWLQGSDASKLQEGLPGTTQSR